MNSADEATAFADEHDEIDWIRRYVEMEEHAQSVFFEIKDELYRQGERELFRYLRWEDVCAMLYDEEDIAERTAMFEVW
jgi:hypothetical protein